MCSDLVEDQPRSRSDRDEITNVTDRMEYAESLGVVVELDGSRLRRQRCAPTERGRGVTVVVEVVVETVAGTEVVTGGGVVVGTAAAVEPADVPDGTVSATPSTAG